MRFGLFWLLAIGFVEIWSITRVSHYVGGLATLVLLIAGVIFGLQLMRSQGISSMIKSSKQMQAGESPLGTIAEGVVKAFAGILLIVPGFVSDIVALIILLPFVRKGVARYLAKKGRFQGFGAGSFGNGGFNGFGGFGGFGPRGANDDTSGNVYEHDGPAKRKDNEILEGQVIEHRPDDKPES